MNILLLLVSFRYVIFQMGESRGILISFALCSVGVGALKFLQDPPRYQTSHVGGSVDYNCTTDDPNATVLLLSYNFWTSYNVIPVSPNKLLLRKQVFTIVNLTSSDEQYYYKCNATDQSGQTIEWNTGSMLFVHPGLYENSE